MRQANATRSGDLGAIADEDGVFAIVAMDQRNTLRRMLTATGRPSEPDDLRAFKVEVADALSPGASGMLLDPDFGVPAVQEARALHDGCGLLVAAEPADRGNYNGEPRTHRLAELDAAWARAMGADAVKFLVQLRPDRPLRRGEPDIVAEVLAVVAEVVRDCRKVGIPSVIENLVYTLPGEEALSPEHRADQIVEAARLIAEVGPDLLKLEYPGSPADCRRVAEAVGGPWAVLSAGVAFEEFSEALRISCDEGGASGFIAGRALWKEAAGLDGPERAEFLGTVARRRFDQCLEAVAGRARPWTEVRVR